MNHTMKIQFYKRYYYIPFKISHFKNIFFSSWSIFQKPMTGIPQLAYYATYVNDTIMGNVKDPFLDICFFNILAVGYINFIICQSKATYAKE